MTWELSYRFIWDYCVACKLLWNIIWSINSLFTNNLKYFIGEENVVRLPKCSWFRFSLSFSSTIMDSFGTFHFHLPHFTSALSRALVRIWFPFTCSLSVSLSMISSSVSLSVVQSSVSLQWFPPTLYLECILHHHCHFHFVFHLYFLQVLVMALIYFSCYKSSCIKYKKNTLYKIHKHKKY